MTSRLYSDAAPERPAAPPAPSPDGEATADAAAPQADTPQQADTPKTETPHIASPPTSPWWTAPAGRPVNIPAFGRALIDTLAAMLSPAPRPVPIRVRAHARR